METDMPEKNEIGPSCSESFTTTAEQRQQLSSELFEHAYNISHSEDDIFLCGETVSSLITGAEEDQSRFTFLGDFYIEEIAKRYGCEITEEGRVTVEEEGKMFEFIARETFEREFQSSHPSERILMSRDGGIIDYFGDITNLSKEEIEEIFSDKPVKILALEAIERVGQQVRTNGWVAKVRNHGSLVFIDLRDFSGTIQLVLDKGRVPFADKIGLEYVLEARGVVKKREEGYKNPKIPTGEIEIDVQDIRVLNESKTPPFPLDKSGEKTDENLRLEYRYIDIRREAVRELIEARHRLLMQTRLWFDQNGFTEVQTPLLTVSSPEGARDYLVPSRLYNGEFYALPQAPQQYKQLLMVGGMHRYFQIAPCFRDEDPRADRHSGEFYQIDAEFSFITRNEIFRTIEPYFLEIAKNSKDRRLLQYRFPRIPYSQVIEDYGLDKPDLRFEMLLVDLTEEFRSSEMQIFQASPSVRAIAVDREFTKKEIEEITERMRLEGAKGLAWFSLDEGQFGGNMAKFFNTELQNSILKKLKEKGYSIKGKQTIFAFSDEYPKASKYAGLLRSQMGDLLKLKDPTVLAFAWVVDFPMFEWDEKGQKWDFGHNPFSMPKGGLKALRTEKPGEILAEQFDLVCNGYELASGSIRNHDPKTFIEAFKIVGYSEEETRSRFGHMISAFEYGAPPHGGFAIGFDRFMMLLYGITNIKDVYAFPKTNAKELMTGAPRRVPQEDLDVLGITIKGKK